MWTHIAHIDHSKGMTLYRTQETINLIIGETLWAGESQFDLVRSDAADHAESGFICGDSRDRSIQDFKIVTNLGQYE